MPRDIEKKLFDFYVSGFVMWSSLLLASTVAFFTLLLDKTVGTKPLFGFLHSILLATKRFHYGYCVLHSENYWDIFLMNYMLEELNLDKLHKELIGKYDAFSS